MSFQCKIVPVRWQLTLSIKSMQANKTFSLYALATISMMKAKCTVVDFQHLGPLSEVFFCAQKILTTLKHIRFDIKLQITYIVFEVV